MSEANIRRTWIVAIAIGFVVVQLAKSDGFQIMPREKEQSLRASIPPITDDVLAAKINEAMLYTEAEMPRSHQFQMLSGGQGNPFTVFISSYQRVNNIDPFTNANREPPWDKTGGVDQSAKSAVLGEFRFVWLPKQADGRPWPVAVYRDPLDKSGSVNMPIPLGYKWVFPYGAIVGEVLAMRFSDGFMYTYEMRIRTREIDDWEIEIYRPYPTLQSLYDKLRSIDPNLLAQFSTVQMVQKRTVDNHPLRRAFTAEAAELVLPGLPSDVSKQLLLTETFKPCMGIKFAISEGNVTLASFAATTRHADQIVPPNYEAHFLGVDRDSCKKCHETTLMHADRFAQRDWYGNVRGSDGILSYLPFDPTSIGMGRQPRLRADLHSAGLVEAYDPARHPANVYSTSRYDVKPAHSYPNRGQITIGG